MRSTLTRQVIFEVFSFKNANFSFSAILLPEQKLKFVPDELHSRDADGFFVMASNKRMSRVKASDAKMKRRKQNLCLLNLSASAPNQVLANMPQIGNQRKTIPTILLEKPIFVMIIGMNGYIEPIAKMKVKANRLVNMQNKTKNTKKTKNMRYTKIYLNRYTILDTSLVPKM